jgi:hypothetical protein
MGNLLSIKAARFQWVMVYHRRLLKGTADHYSRRIDDFLSIHVAGNKSGAPLLTVFVLTHRRGDERFTKRRAPSAVLKGMAKLAT